VAARRGLTIGIGTGLVGLVLGGALWWTTRDRPQIAPDFAVTALDGQAVRLSAYRGKVVLLNLWTTWCPPCRDEMPSMEALHRRLKDRDFVLLAVSQDEDGKRVVEPFVKDMGLTFPILVDPEHQVGDRYGVWGYPESFLIDRDGVIVERIIGPIAPRHVSQVEALIAAGGAAGPHGASPSEAPAPHAPS
jgi:peroxiredoxin